MIMALPSQVRKASRIRHKVFLSYYHRDDQVYRNEFEAKSKHIYATKSVQSGDIDSDNSAHYIKCLIRDGFVEDASIVVVLVGPKTRCRKHVDWEISAGLNKKVGGYSGLIGILLPTFPTQPNNKFYSHDLPARLNVNADSGYASLYLWRYLISDVSRLTLALDEAFDRRVKAVDKINNSLPQMTHDTCA